jgi:hypothetical protein
LEKFRGHNVLVSSYGTDGEGSALGAQIISILQAAHINAADSRGGTMVTGGFDIGIHVRAPAEEYVFASALKDALSSVGKLMVAPINDPQPQAGSMMAGGGQTFVPGIVFVSLVVGIKPVPILPPAK